MIKVFHPKPEPAGVLDHHAGQINSDLNVEFVAGNFLVAETGHGDLVVQIRVLALVIFRIYRAIQHQIHQPGLLADKLFGVGFQLALGGYGFGLAHLPPVQHHITEFLQQGAGGDLDAL